MLQPWAAATAVLSAATAAAAPAPPASAARLLAQAEAAANDLEYARALELVERALAQQEVSAVQRRAAYVLQGSALAIIGNPVAAEAPFRSLLRAEPELDLPAVTSPKVLAVFRKVQVEERAIREQVQALERERIVEQLRLRELAPPESIGGRALRFAYRLRDPRSVVDAIHVSYRRAGERAYSSLALALGDDGAWAAELPPAWTENEAGLTIEYFVETRDGGGRALTTLGAPAAPRRIDLVAGTVADAAPLYERPWFWALTGIAVAGVAAAVVLTYQEVTALPHSQLGQLPF